MRRISGKITFSFATVLFLAFAALWVQYYQLVELRDQSSEIVNKQTVLEGAINEFIVDFVEYASISQSAPAYIDQSLLKKRKDQWDELYERMNETIQKISDSSYEGHAPDTVQLKNMLDSFHDKSLDVFISMEAFAQMKAINQYDNNVDPLRVQIDTFLGNELAKIQQARSESFASLEMQVISAGWWLFVFVVGMIVIGLVMGTYLTQNVIAPIRLLTEFLNRDDRQDTSQQVPFVEREDEIGQFAQAFDKMLQLEYAKQVAEKASEAKSEFLANMSHELRTPLNSIMGMTRMIIESKALDEDNEDMAKTVYKSATNLLDTVNDILDISKIEAGSIVLEELAFDFKDTVSGIVSSLSQLASSKGVALDCRFINDDIPYVIGDPLRINRVLINLVGNAIKYTSPDETGNKKVPEVNILVDVQDIGYGRAEIYCEVQDTGIGIPHDKQETIFEKFTQADVSTTRKYGGTGLGLSITKELVELMGGEIGVRSQVDKGSTFWFKIPFEITDEIDETNHEDVKRKRRIRKRDSNRYRVDVDIAKILVAEDHLLNKALIKRLLERMGFTDITIVENGKLAVKTYKSGSYDVILMDCHMPEMNGYETTQAIRQIEKLTNRHIPIVALTADAMKGTQERCLDAGMDEYVTKPIDADELKEVLMQWVKIEENGQVDQTSDLKPAKKKATSSHDVPVDMELLKEYANSDADIKLFVDTFIQQSEESTKILCDHCVDGANDNWVGAAHKLKGGAGMLGAKTLHRLCAEAQKISSGTADERKVVLDSIMKEYESVKKYLSEQIS